MDIFQNQCSESLGFDSMLSSNHLHSPLPELDGTNQLPFEPSPPYFASITQPPATGLEVTSVNDMVLPSIFVKIPMQINQQYQQQESSPEGIKCEDKSEPIKKELGDLRALEKGTAMVQLPEAIESYLNDVADVCGRMEERCLNRCDYCPFVTLSTVRLREHQQLVHPDGTVRDGAGIEVIGCLACDNKFYQRTVLELHLLEDHLMVREEVDILMKRDIEEELAMLGDGGNSHETSKSRIYIKNVQLLKKPDVIRQESEDNRCQQQQQEAHQQDTQQQQQQEHQQQDQQQQQELQQPLQQQQHQEQHHEQQQQQQQQQQGQQQQQQQQHQEQQQQQVQLAMPPSYEHGQQLVGQTVMHSEPPSQPEMGDPMQTNGGVSKIYIRDMSLLQNINFTSSPGGMFHPNNGVLHEGVRYGFEAPSPSLESLNSQSPPISVDSRATSPSQHQQQNKIFIRNVDILRNPLLTTQSTCATTIGGYHISRGSSSESLYTTPPPVPPPPVMPMVAAPVESLNMVIIPAASVNGAGNDRSSAFTVGTGTAPVPGRSKIFIKNISVLKQPTIHLKSVDELNLMTIDQLQLQNLLPSGAGGGGAPSLLNLAVDCGDGRRKESDGQCMEQQGFSDVLGGTADALDEYDERCGYEELNVCDYTDSSGLVESEGVGEQLVVPDGESECAAAGGAVTDASEGLIDVEVDPGDAVDEFQGTAFDDGFLLLQANESAAANRLEDLQPFAGDAVASAQEEQEEEVQEFRHKDEDIMFVGTQDVINLDPPAPEDDPPRIYVSENLMEPPAGENAPVGNSGNADGPRPRGRPKGAKQTGISILKRLYTNLTTDEEGHRCDFKECGARFRSTERLQYHKQCHVPDVPLADGIRCPECGSREFRSWNTLHTHLWREHSVDMELYSCHLCSFKTPVLCRLNNTHMKIHSEERNFKCAICDKAFKNNKQLRNHRRSHRESLPAGVDAGDGSTATTDGEQPAAPGMLQVKCVKCSLRFTTQRCLRNHMETKHPAEGAQGGKHRCTLCGMLFNTRYLLQSHAAKHSDEKRFKCEHCDYSTNDHNAFRRHKMRHNTKGGHMYKCSYCDYTSIQSTTYRKHLERMHAEAASTLLYKCVRCPFVSISEVKYLLHKSKHDADEEQQQQQQQTAESSPKADPQEDESVNSDVMIVDKADDPQMLQTQQPIIRPAVFANNLSKVDNFYRYNDMQQQQQPRILKLTDQIDTGAFRVQRQQQLAPVMDGQPPPVAVPPPPTQDHSSAMIELDFLAASNSVHPHHGTPYHHYQHLHHHVHHHHHHRHHEDPLHHPPVHSRPPVVPLPYDGRPESSEVN